MGCSMSWKYPTDNSSRKHQRLQIGVDSRHNIESGVFLPPGHSVCTPFCHRGGNERRIT